MKYLSQDLTISIVCSLLLCYVIYYIYKNNKDNENKISLKFYVKFVIASSVLIYGMLYIRQKMGNNLNLDSTPVMLGGGGGNYQPNIIIGEPNF
tara:strand:+ start:389 stop:670 length:282 start_codon:yes stop_codon:yes gene_type:complete